MKKRKQVKSLNVDRLGGALEKRYNLAFYSNVKDFSNPNHNRMLVHDDRKPVSGFKKSRASTFNRV